jgi:transposase
VHAREKAADKELGELLEATDTTLTELNGIGTSGAARLLVEVGDVTRFPSKAHFASWNGTAPIDASSGDNVRHRLSRKGNRQINRVLHIMATVQLRNPTEGRAYYDRRKTDGKTSMEAMRALNAGSTRSTSSCSPTPCAPPRRGPGAHPGTALQSSAADSHPDVGTSDQSLPGPATS